MIGRNVEFTVGVETEPQIVQTLPQSQQSRFSSIQGSNFSKKVKLYVNGILRESIYVSENELWAYGLPDEPWQVSINEGYQKTEPFTKQFKEISLRSIHPQIIPLHGIDVQELTIEGDFSQVQDLQALCLLQGLNSTKAFQVDSTRIKCSIPATIHSNTVNFSLMTFQEIKIRLEFDKDSTFQLKFVDPVASNLYFKTNMISLVEKDNESINLHGQGFSEEFTYQICFQNRDFQQVQNEQICFQTIFQDQFSLKLLKESLMNSQLEHLQSMPSQVWQSQKSTIKLFWNGKEQMQKEIFQDIFFTNQLFKDLFAIDTVQFLSYDEILSKNLISIHLTNPQIVQFAESIKCKEPFTEIDAIVVHHNRINCQIAQTEAILKIRAFEREWLLDFSIFQESDHLITVDQVLPLQIPFGHQNFKLKIKGINLNLIPLLCLFEYSNDSSGSANEILISKVDSDQQCLVRYLPTTTEILSQNWQVKIMILDGNGREKVFFEDFLSISVNHNIVIQSVLPAQFYTPATLTVKGNSFDSSCSCISAQNEKTVIFDSKFIDQNTLVCSIFEGNTKEVFMFQTQKYSDGNQKSQVVSLSVFCNKSEFSVDNPQALTILPQFQIDSNQKIIIETKKQSDHETEKTRIPVRGNNFHSDLYCVLEFVETSKIYETLIFQLKSHSEVVCEFQFENEYPLSSKLWLKHYNSEDQNQITISNMVDVVFIPRIQIWQADSFASYFVRNIGQQINLISNLGQPNHQIYPYDSIWCEFKFDGTLYKTEFSKTSESDLICKEPFISHQLAGDSIRLTVVAEYAQQRQLFRSNSLDIQLKSLPIITEVTPLYTPVGGVSGTRHTINGNNFVAETTYLVLNRTIEVPLTVISAHQATFEAPLWNRSGLMTIQVATRHSESISDSQISLNYIELPSMERLVPTIIAQVSVSRVTIEGRNFTEYTQCVVMSQPLPTIFLTSSMIQCEVDPQQFAPHAFSDNKLDVRLLERDLYLNLQSQFSLLLTNLPYVSKVEPQRVFSELTGGSQTVKVHVSNVIPKHGDSNLGKDKAKSELLFCKIHEKVIVRVSRIIQDSGCEELNQTGAKVYDTGRSEHLNLVGEKCRTDQLIYECQVPFLPKKLDGTQFHVQILTGRDSEFTKANLDESQGILKVLARPQFTGIRDQNLPYPKDLSNSVSLIGAIDNKVPIYLTGVNFQSATFNQNDRLVCQISGTKFQTKTPMTVESNSQGTCLLDPNQIFCLKLPCFAKITLAFEIQGTELRQGVIQDITKSQMLRGSARLLLYKVPEITKLQPNIALKQGGQRIMIHGRGLIRGFGDIICAFGDYRISAKIHKIDSLVECESPVTSDSGLLDFSISIDGGKHFIQSATAQKFGIIESTLQVTETVPQEQTFWGETSLEIRGTNFPYATLNTLSGSLEPQIMCKFDFSVVSEAIIFTLGVLKSDTIMICPFERHLKASSQIKLSVSFNKYEWILVSESITIINDVQSRLSIQQIDLFDPVVASQQTYATLLQLQGLTDICPVKSEFKGDQVHLKVPILWNTPILLYVKIEDQLTELPQLTKADFFNTVDIQEKIEVSRKAMTTLQFKVGEYIYVEYAYEKIPLHQQMINLQLYDLYQWLIQNVDSILACEGQPQEFTAQIRTFTDSTIEANDTEMRMTCKIGYNMLGSPFERSSQILNVDCVNPFYPIDYDQLLPNEPLTMTSISPHVAFVFDENIRVRIEATPLYKTNSVACKFQDVNIKGTFLNDEQGEAIFCVIPSLQYLLEETQTGLESNLNLPVQISQNGVDFSNNSYTFKFLQTSQQSAIDYSVGPDIGGTVIQIRLDDFVKINGEDLPSYCVFSGHEKSIATDYGVVSASHIGPNLIQCVSPPLFLDQQAIQNGLIFDTELIATVKVHVDLLERRSLTHFWFSYVKDAQVTHFDPQNMYFGTQTDPRTLKIFGQHFIPITEESLCKVTFDEELGLQAEIPARYINNRTMECDIPAPPAQKDLPFSAKIEVSFNQGQQYTTQQSLFWYSSRDTIVSVFPNLNFVQGNTLLSVTTSYFFDKNSVDAQCKFRYTDPDTLESHTRTTNLVSSDIVGVVCLQPPADLISSKLNSEGGQTHLSVSSNGIDFSNELAFTYLPAVQFTQVFPIFVQMDKQMTVQISGTGFVEASIIDLMRVRLTRIIYLEKQVAQVFVVQEVSFDGVDSLAFTWPNSVFLDKDQVSLEVTFDEQIWFTVSTELVTVYRTIELTRTWPTHVYTEEVGTEIYVQAGETNNPERGGDIWDMTLFDNLRCKFESEQSGIEFTTARYFNSTHAGCQIPTYTQAEEVQVAITIDGGNTFSQNTVPISLVNPPQILSLNNTEYFYTLDEQVYIELRGNYLRTSKHTYVRIGDQVQLIPPTVQSDSDTKSESTTDPQSAIPTPTDILVFKMPLQLDLGVYEITVSTDGMNYKPDPPSTPADTSDDRFYVTITKCPNGFTCEQEIATVCPDAHFCQFDNYQVFEPLVCPLGTYMREEGAGVCTPCDIGKYCPNVGLFVPQQCPHGFLCQAEGQKSLTELKECPAGYVCPTETEVLDPKRLKTAGNMKKCPDGLYCPKGVLQSAHIYGNFTTPQVCKDGTLCAQSKHHEDLEDMAGAVSQFGNLECQPGTYCKKGLTQECPKGHHCPTYDLDEPQPCTAGYYMETKNATECDICPFGTYCTQSRMEIPVKCIPGWTCQHEGGPYPQQLCPGGNFCHQSTVTNMTNSTLRDFYKPNLCYEGTYCLDGAFTPIIDQENEQAAQACIAGTFCSEGSDSPDGKGKCKEGFYCPEGSNEMIPAQPGSSALGTGNTSPSLCAPGSFQDEVAQPSCKACPRGYFCPEQAMIEPIICNIGTFSKAESSTQCTNCPLGTYSDLQGVRTEEDCKVCESRFRCTQTGLTKMQMAVECQEGYQCGYGTTNTVMLNSKVESGYFGDYNITGEPEYKLCLPGRYCPSATAASKVKQLDCLRGYFCPFGTAASLSIKGDFNEDIKQLNKWKLVERIEKFIEETEAEMERFDAAYANVANIDQLVTDLMKAGDEQAAFQIQWEYYKYNLNATILEERRKYLEEDLVPDVRCPEDDLLPDELIESYTKNGTNLRCPKGTQSERASWCLGQCVINLANKQSVSVLNPVTDVIRITSLAKKDLSLQASNLGSLAERLEKENRRLQEGVKRNLALNDAQRDFDIVGPGIFDTLHRQTVRPLEIVRISFNFTDLPEKLIYNDHFSITILDEQDKEYRLPHYFSQDNNRVTKKNELLQIRIFNWTPSDKEFQIGIDLFHGLFIPKLKDLSDKVIIEAYQAERQTRFTNHTHGVIIGEVLLDGKTLPYNTPDYGNDPDLWLDFVSKGSGVNPTTKGLDKDSFDSTYWQSKQINSVIMPWLPYFSNCDGFDSHIIFYDLFEYSDDCKLRSYDDIRIVSPIPTLGLEPEADRCNFAIKCRFDEDLSFKRSQTTRWYNLSEETIMFYLTKDPIPIENFHKLEDSAVVQTFYNSLVEDGSDDLIPVPFIPSALSGIPRVVEIDFLYYQKDSDTKVVQSMSVSMRNYTENEFGPNGEVDPNYTLQINYKALDYFSLTNSFQFDIPIYILLFNLVSILMIISMLSVWILQILCSRAKVSPKIRFKHLFNVTFQAPATGVLLSCIPALMVGVATVFYRESTLFETVAASWTDLGSELSNKVIVQQKRGRVGLIFCVSGFLFLLYGAAGIIYVPSEEEEQKILNKQKMAHQRERLELSQDSEDDLKETTNFEREEKIRVRHGLQNKQKHFFVMCIFTTIFLMIKLEFSYTKLFSQNIKTFLLLFMLGDIVIEQLLVRLIMAEALLVSPILGTFVVTEFIMTMGAEDLQSFIISYFIESTIVVVSRIFVGPWVEKLEAFTQITIIQLSQRIKWVRDMFKGILVKQLATQMQLMSLTEYNQRRKTAEDQKEQSKKRHFYDWQREKGEGLEGLLGSVNTYSSQTQALFLIPFVLLFIMYFANETKIPQNYKIRKTDLQYYFTFTAVIILPQLIIDVFILHILEIRQGYKIYDYFTYCNYRFITRQARWITSENRLDHSIVHTYRSLDAFCFSSQYYYLISLSSWGILFLYIGAMAVIRNLYNPFADPILLFFACAVVGIAQPVKWILNFTAYKLGLWRISQVGKIRFEGAQITKLDERHNLKKLVKNIQTNPFRSKFLVVNREWIISNIALILGGRQFQEGAGAEFNYIKNVYQTVVDLRAEKDALKEEQDQLKGHLKMMPYNQARNNEQVDVSSDCFSDLPETEWDIPESLAKVYVFRLAKMWLDWARQNMRLKIMIADIVHRNLKGHCMTCGEKFRLQVIQKIDFNALTDKFRQENVGVPFTQDRWRRFYKRHQIFTTLCMECAYIDNLNLGQMRARNPELHKLMTENALKHIGAAEVLVAKKLKRKHVRNIALYWVWQARSSILHKHLEEQQRKADAMVEVDKTQIDTDEQRKKILGQEANDRSIDEIISLTNDSQKEESSQTFVNF